MKLTTILTIGNYFENILPGRNTRFENFKDYLLSNSNNIFIEFAEVRKRLEIKNYKKTLWGTNDVGYPQSELEFSITLTKDDIRNYKNLLQKWNPTKTPKEIHRLVKNFSVASFNLQISYLCLIANLASPDSCKPDSNLSYINSKKNIIRDRTIKISNNFDYLFDFCAEQKIPIPEIEYGTVWDWYLKNASNFYSKNQTSLIRSVAAYVQFLLTSYNDFEALLWLMIGIESIYASDSNNDLSITSQIKNKSELIIDSQPSLKKQLASMYKIRSKFMHGKMTVPPIGGYSDDQYENGGEDICNAVGCAHYLLVKTLHYAINNRWNDLSFDHHYSIKGE